MDEFFPWHLRDSQKDLTYSAGLICVMTRRDNLAPWLRCREEWIFEPECKAKTYQCNIGEPEEVFRAILAPIDVENHHDNGGPPELEQQWQALGDLSHEELI